MRDFLEDAHQHQQDGYGRAQKHVRRELPKRFYKAADFVEGEGGFAIRLDGKQTKTPGGHAVIVPRIAIAEEVVAEWNAQQDRINPDTMPMLRLINSAVEGGEGALQPLRDEIAKYAGNDLLLYRADTPHELVRAQEEAWDPVLVAIARQFGVKFQPAIGIIHQAQPAETLSKLAAEVNKAELFTAAAMMSITGITGSGLLAIALWAKLVDADTAWKAAFVDEDHNIRLWGEDAEVTARRAHKRTEFDAAMKVIEALR